VKPEEFFDTSGLLEQDNATAVRVLTTESTPWRSDSRCDGTTRVGLTVSGRAMRRTAVAFVVLASLVAGAARAQGQPAATIVDLGPRLEELRAGKVPALGAAVITADGVVARGVAGVRKQGDDTPVEITDRWHVGSITKSFTSTLFARLVEAGKVRWDQKLAELLPEAAGTPYAGVTFDLLLSHRAGMVANPSTPSLLGARGSKDPLPEQRRKTVTEVLASAPVHEPGTAFLYSNAGYVVAGAVLERLSGKAWEELVREQVLAPLNLGSAGFGPPGTAGAVEQPYGHLYPVGATRPPHPMPPGPLADNPQLLGPAGTLHLSIDDLATYVREHLEGEIGAGSLLAAESYRRLHRAVGDSYALGWVDVAPEWADGERLVWHNGSNTMWYAMIGFFPARRIGLVVVTNGGAGGEATVTRAFQELAKSYLAIAGAPSP
jgi:CubicO group peptidase (beta-lactamase class C family)